MSDHSERRFMLNVMAAILEGARVNNPNAGLLEPSADLAFRLEMDVGFRLEEEMQRAKREEGS
jgi:hypothetical protein